jgi:ribosomal protein RSM22 (predicted rRNA methylase)
MIPPELPPPLQAMLDELVRGADRARLEAAATGLTAAYREGGAARPARSADDVLAYAAQRAPATYAATAAVLGRLREQRPRWRPRSLLDVGSGPGIAAWAATTIWPGLERVVFVEAEPEMVALGRRLAPPGAEWVHGELDALPGAFDLVLAGYVLNELPPEQLERAAATLWRATADTLVAVEPGTPSGHGRVLALRAAVVAAGGFTLAPCPHDDPCPLEPPDWCHFSARLQRGEAHRAVKAVSRGFEDEKYSYVALGRERAPRAEARIIRQPQIRPGHVLLQLSTRAGNDRVTVTKRDRERYRRARKSAWGDTFGSG